MTENISKRVVTELTPKDERVTKQQREENSARISLRENMEKNCLDCFISEMDTQGITIGSMRERGVVADQVLEGICENKKLVYKCNNRVHFEENPNLARPHLSNLHAMYRIQQMCNRG